MSERFPRCLLVFLLAALALPAQSLEVLATAYREKPTPARRDALLRLAKAHPKDAAGAQALLAVAVTEIEGKEYALGIERLEAARKRLPQIEDFISWYVGSALFAQEDFTGALANLELVWKHSPSSPLQGKALLLTAKAYLETGAPGEAVKLLKPRYTTLPQPQGDLVLGSAYEASKDLPSSADCYQRVYYRYPVSDEGAEAGAALERLKLQMGSSYPPPMPRTMLDRAERLLDAGEARIAKAELEDLTRRLGGTERELAQVRVGAADYRSGLTQAAYRYLRALEVSSPETGAERLYYLVACARRLNDRPGMLQYVDELGARHPKSKWRLKALVWAANEFLLENDTGTYEPLYKACYDSFPEEPLAQYCHWKVAWSAYLRKSPGAADLFQEHLKRFPDGEKASAALYFLGRLAEKAGDLKTGRAYYEKILRHYNNYYYAALAEQRLARAPLARVVAAGAQLPEEIQIPRRDLPDSFRPTAASRRRMERARLLSAAGLFALAESELRFGAREDGQAHVLAIDLARSASARGAPQQGIRYIKSVFPEYLLLPLDQAPADFWKLAFPFPYRSRLERYCRQYDLDPYLFAGLIRQESEFDPKATSRAKARGLTQILPSTGRSLSRKLRLRYSLSRLYQPDYNLRLGTYYFRYLLNQHNGSLEATLASYNGGKSRVDGWQSWASFDEQAEFVETIPITETRNYVQSVLRNAAMYRRLYGPESAKVTSKNGNSARSAPPRKRRGR